MNHPIEANHHNIVRLLKSIRGMLAMLDAPPHGSALAPAPPKSAASGDAPCKTSDTLTPLQHPSETAIAAAPTIQPHVRRAVETMRKEYASVRDRYYIGVSPFVISYYLADAAVMASMQASYVDFLGRKNILGGIGTCMRRLAAIAAIVGIAELTAALGEAANHGMTVPHVEKTRHAECPECGGRLVLWAESSEKECAGCGTTAPLYGGIYEDAQMHCEAVVRTRAGRHHPSTHCRIWVGRIQAWPGPDIPGEVFDYLKECMARDRINRNKLRCERLRMYLKKGNLTAYNNFVPFIRKILTGVAPPQLTADELADLYTDFNRVAMVLKRLRPDNNITYYPGIIYMLLDRRLPNGVRKAQILDCIHLQSNKTMRLVYQICARACAELDNLKLKPTNKHEHRLLL